MAAFFFDLGIFYRIQQKNAATGQDTRNSAIFKPIKNVKTYIRRKTTSFNVFIDSTRAKNVISR